MGVEHPFIYHIVENSIGIMKIQLIKYSLIYPSLSYIKGFVNLLYPIIYPTEGFIKGFMKFS
jgi:hypothetical protein